jgi:hypothetical protein
MPSRDEQLIKAAYRANFRRVAQLLRQGADVNATNKDGFTVLEGAISSVRFFKKTVVAGKLVKFRVHALKDIQRTVHVLLKAGADPNRLRYDFGSPLISAAGDGNLPILKMLMKAGGDPNRQDALGETALVSAVHSRRPTIVRYLLDKGANPRLKSRNGKSALDIAKERSRLMPAEFSVIHEMLRKAALTKPPGKRAARPKPARGPKLGIKDFTALMYRGHPEWSLLAVHAPAGKVAAEFARLTKPARWDKQVPLKPSCRHEQVARVSVVAGIAGNPWTIVFRSLFNVSIRELDSVPDQAKVLSSKLKTKGIYFIFEDTAGAMGYGLFDKGRILEKADWEVGNELLRFKSKLRDDPELSHVTDGFADETFRSQGIYLPACYPRIDRNKVWLAVDKASEGMIERADFIECKA